VDSDGDLDLASNAGFFVNDGAGSFTATVAYSGDPVDVDGDGDLDVFRMHQRQFEDFYIVGFNGISILLNAGGNVFAPPVAFPMGVNLPLAAAFLHLDDDGKPDLVLGTRVDTLFDVESVTAFLNDGLPYHQGDTDRNGVLDVCEMFHRGDVDSSGTLNITDPIRLLNYLFQGVGEVPCLDAADANNDGEADISDAVFIMNYNFAGGRPPPPPGPPDMSACGPDPEGGDLGCSSYTGCADLES